MNLVGGHTQRASVMVSCCWRMASTGAGRAGCGGEQVWCKPLRLPRASASVEPRGVKRVGFRGMQEGFRGKGC